MDAANQKPEEVDQQGFRQLDTPDSLDSVARSMDSLDKCKSMDSLGEAPEDATEYGDHYVSINHEHHDDACLNNVKEEMKIAVDHHVNTIQTSVLENESIETIIEAATSIQSQVLVSIIGGESGAQEDEAQEISKECEIGVEVVKKGHLKAIYTGLDN